MIDIRTVMITLLVIFVLYLVYRAGKLQGRREGMKAVARQLNGNTRRTNMIQHEVINTAEGGLDDLYYRYTNNCN